jgi:hypothetical protein
MQMKLLAVNWPPEVVFSPLNDTDRLVRVNAPFDPFNLIQGCKWSLRSSKRQLVHHRCMVTELSKSILQRPDDVGSPIMDMQRAPLAHAGGGWRSRSRVLSVGTQSAFFFTTRYFYAISGPFI